MPLNDLVKDYSLTTISQKTNIPVEILDKLINKDWESLQATKSKGFIAIIEREFNVDLSDLKDEAKEYYESHKKEDVFRPIDLVDAQSAGGGGSKIVTNIVALLTIALVAYAGWFYFVKPKNSNLSQQDNNSSGLIKESMDIAKNLVGIQEKPQKQEDKTIEKTLKNEDENNLSVASLTQNSEEKKSEDKKKFDITTDVKESNISIFSEVNNSSNEELESKNSINMGNNTLATEENSSTIKQDVETLLEENKTTQEEKLLEENSTDINSQSIDTNITMPESEKNETVKPLATVMNSITIKPNAKAIWVGLYNLKSGKRVVKVVNGSFTFNTDGSNLAIATGHSKFEISTNNGLVKKFNGKGRKYLYITNDEIKELTKAGYKTLTKRRAW